MLTISEYRDLAAVAGIRDAWRELWWKTPRASFFQSVEWFERHCRHAANVQRPRVLVVSLAGHPVGLVPWVEKTTRSPIGRVRIVCDPLAEQGFFGGPLGREPELTLEAALNHARTNRTWDRLELRRVERGRIDATAGTVADSRGVVDCRGDWVEYLRSRPEAVREDYRRAERTLEARGRVEYIRYRPEGTPLDDDDPRWNLFDEVDAAQRRATAKADRRRALRAMHETATSIAGVDLNVLRFDGRPAAWAYNYRCDGRVEMQRGGARGEFAREASAVLMGRMLHDGFRRGDELYLFDRQGSRTAGGWQTGRMTSRRRVHYSRGGAWPRLARFLSGRDC